ncbi:uncharacterized protein LOC112347490 [Selaginella moellendorffii]|uniref:uncharacterized protein LOC112347490 n=1 Tax=Selaginella moellendorffii TaxID=88036 RepID=UPI000D1C8F17|nr:uncharacterized protein LOC112347490 [Selaginella moellendorffii]|eukprot:XP_024534198.1 uncharacterized protein LOC112347490 [Selaginella moellendorffii]
MLPGEGKQNHQCSPRERKKKEKIELTWISCQRPRVPCAFIAEFTKTLERKKNKHENEAIHRNSFTSILLDLSLELEATILSLRLPLELEELENLGLSRRRHHDAAAVANPVPALAEEAAQLGRVDSSHDSFKHRKPSKYFHYQRWRSGASSSRSAARSFFLGFWRSSKEEEEEELRSCVVDYSSLTPSAARPIDRQVEEGAADDHHLKLYHVRLQDQLQEFLDKTLEIIRVEEEPDPAPVAAPSQEEDDGFHLFGKAPAGITMIERVRDGSLEHRASGKRYIHSTRGWFSSGKNSLENVVIDAESVRVEAEKAREKALAAWKDRISRKEEAIARENSRVAALKQVRGEKWIC